MSHGKERIENDCLNCGAIVQGRYCQDCGQENIAIKEGLWSMIRHFAYDITHYDGKFFKSLGILITKPGFLTAEYLKGKRVKYLNPIKMYVFTSWVFFTAMFFFNPITGNAPSMKQAKLSPEEVKLKQEENAKGKAALDSLARDSAFIASLSGLDAKTKQTMLDGFQQNDTGNSLPSTVATYDSIQSTLPKTERDSWMMSNLKRTSFKINQQAIEQGDGFWTAAAAKFFKSFPYLLFVSLPIYAFYLYLLYWRRRTEYFYADHGLFLIHLYIFTFICLLFVGLLGYIPVDGLHWSLKTVLWLTNFGIMAYGVYYLYKGMRTFYQQSRTRTIAKFLLFNFLCFNTLIFLFVLFFGISLLQMV